MSAAAASALIAPASHEIDYAAPHWQRLRRLAWQSFRFTVPPGWELTSYLTRQERGEFHFSQGLRPMAQLHFRQVPSAPDERRILQAIDDKVPAPAERREPLQFESCGHWHLALAGNTLRFASLYQSPCKVLLQWVFPEQEEGAGADHEAALRAMLDSYRSNGGSTRTWELFGIHVRLPAGFEPVALEPAPADVTLRWEDDRRTVTARRLGMPRHLLATQSLVELAQRLLTTSGFRVLDTEVQRAGGMPSVHARVQLGARRGLDALTGRPYRGESCLWHDEREGRIHLLTQYGPQRNEGLTLANIAEWEAEW